MIDYRQMLPIFQSKYVWNEIIEKIEELKTQVQNMVVYLETE